MLESNPTGYRRLSPRQARCVLALTGIVLAGAVALTLSPWASSNLRPRQGRPNDVSLYRAEVERIRHGESYYQAAAAELPARGYPTRSVFNWRTPLPMWLLGKMPSAAWGKALLGLMALAAIMMALAALARDEGGQQHRHSDRSEESGMQPQPGGILRCAQNDAAANDAAANDAAANDAAANDAVPPVAPATGRMLAWLGCAVLLIGAMLPTVLADLLLMPELWAGTLIALSLAAYGIGRPRLGVACGLLAVLFRELALPYGLLCAAQAWHSRRRREALAWLIGLAAWLAFFGLHWWRVRGLIPPEAISHRHGWICCGGAAFVISTAQMNAYLLCLPQWATAVYLVAALVGFAGWNTPWGTRVGLSACLFLSAFAVVGQSFNQYWGAMIAPLLCFGAARAPRALGELWQAATARSQHVRQRSAPAFGGAG
jgi:hypothetical protein